MIRILAAWLVFAAVVCLLAAVSWGQFRPECCPDCVEIGTLHSGAVLVASAADLEGVAWRPGATLYLVTDPTWADCLAGPVASPGEVCVPFDRDADGDVDLRDFVEASR